MSILIVGGGAIGSTLAERLATERKDVVVVEANEDRVRQLREGADIQVIHGSGSRPDVLRAAGLDEADMVIAVTESDEVNIVACLVAANESVVPTRIARVRDPELAAVIPAIFGEGGLDLNINPEEVAARELLDLLRVPGASGVFQFANGKVLVVSFVVEAECPAEGVRLAELRPKLGVECNVVAVSRDGELLIPDGDTDLRRGDRVYAAGQPDALGEMAAFLGKKNVESRRVVISGGGNVSYYLAGMLEDHDLAPKILEPDADRCKFLVERLKRTVVLQGKGTDPSLLREENAASADAFLSLTADEEDNVLSALLAKREGVSKVVALVNQKSYTELVSALGVDAVVSPNQAAVSAILQFIRRGKVVSVTTLGDERAEVLEIVALETSELVGKPLCEISLEDATVGAIVRAEEVIIPSGNDVIQAGDHVVVFALASAIPALERQMTVKLQYF